MEILREPNNFINKYFWIKQYVDDGTVVFHYLITTKMITDIFTKQIVGHMFFLLLYFIINPYYIGDGNLDPN